MFYRPLNLVKNKMLCSRTFAKIAKSTSNRVFQPFFNSQFSSNGPPFIPPPFDDSDLPGWEDGLPLGTPFLSILKHFAC